jgi:hypothetical protein
MLPNTPETPLQIAKRKLEVLQKADIIAVDANVKFKLDIEIQELKQKIGALQDEETLTGQSFGLNTKKTDLELDQILADYDDSQLEIGLLHYVNCNRRSAFDTFWEAFRRNTTAALRYQVYFVTACQTQRPDRFSERLLYEVKLDYEREDEEAATFYRHDDDGRLITFVLPLLPDLESSKRAFRKHFAREFELSGEEEIDTFLTGKAVDYEYRAIFLAYEIDGNEWYDFLPDYYRWIVENFRAIDRKGTTFFLSFVHYVDDAHKNEKMLPENRRIMRALDELARQNDIACHLSELPEVDLRDFRSWLRGVQIRDLDNQDDLIEYAIRQLKPPERKAYIDRALINMQRIDKLQKDICDILLKK